MSQVNSRQAKETAMRGSTGRFRKMAVIFSLVAAVAIGWAGPAGAATLTWDADGATAGQTDGAGVWLGTGQWWDGAANQDWVSGSDAVFGNGGAGGAVTLAGPTAVNSLTLNSFTGTYTLGTAGQAITLSAGLTMNLGAGDVTIVSPVTLGGPQAWTNNSSGLLTVGTGAVDNGGYLLTVGGSGNTTISGVIGNGAGGITKNDGGTLTLSAANTYTGGTTVSAGQLNVNAQGTDSTNSAIGTGALTITGGTIDATSGAIDLSGTTNNAVTIGGNFAFGGSNALNLGTGAVDNSGSRTITLNGNNPLTLGAMTNTANAATTLTVNNGTGTDSDTVLNLGSYALTGGANTAVRTTTITGTGNVTILGEVSNGQAYNNALTKAGAGTLTLAGANTYSGTTAVSAGTLIVGVTGNLGAPAASFVFNGGTLQITGTTLTSFSGFGHTVSSGNATVSLDIDNAANTFTADQVLAQGSGGLTKLGAGTLILNQANNYSGLTTATAGTLTLSHALAIQNSALDTTGAGAVTLSGVTTPTFGGLSGAVDLGTGGVLAAGYSGVTALMLNPISGSVTYGGVISNGSGDMTLTKTGAGTQVLQGVNTYAGATNINAGTLTLSGGGTILTTSGITLTGGNLTLANATAGEATLNRVPDGSGITANGGTITYTNTSGEDTYAETIGSVALTSGQLNLVEATAQAGTGSQTLTLSGLTNTGSTNTSAVTFSAATTGPQASGNKNMIVVTGGGTTTSGQIIGPWATTGTAAGNQTDYAVYNADYVVPAAIAASAETTWATAANAYTLSGGATLGGTRTITALRATGAAQTLTLGANLETYGLLNGGTGLLTVSGTGALTTATGGGNLSLTTGNNAITVSAPINDNGGAVTLVKSGSSTLTLSGTNGYSGGTVISAGTVTISSDTNFGDPAGGITFNGTPRLNLGAALSSTRTITLNDGANPYFDCGSGVIAGPVIGSGGFNVNKQSQGNPGLTLSNTNNTFTGPMTLPDKGASGYASYTFNSLGDAPGAGIISLGYGGGQGSIFIWGSGAIAPLVLNYRQFDVGYTSFINNNNTASSNANTITINTDMLFTGAGNRTLTLGGTNTGANTFAGIIPDGPSGTVISLTKADAGTWVLAGANTYTGATTITAGTLSVGADDNLGNANSLVFNGGTLRVTGTALTSYAGGLIGTHAVTQNAAKTIGLDIADAGNTFTVSQVLAQTTGGLTKAGAGTLVFSNANTYTGATTVSNGKLLLGQGGSMGATAVSVTGAGRTYGTSYASSGNNIAGGSTLALASGTTLDMRDNNTNTLSFIGAGASTLSGAGLYFDLGATTADKVELVGAATVTNTNTFYFDFLGSVKMGNDAYTLITAASGLTGAAFAIGTTLPGYTLTLDATGTAIYLNVFLDVVPGDTNDDKVVDAADFITLKKNFGKSTGAGTAAGDFNASGTVNWADLSILMNNMGVPVGTPATAPEPCSAMLLVFGAAAMLRRRRK